MIKDFFRTLTQSGELTDRGYGFIVIAAHVLLLATVGFIIV